jgi:predicted phosphodiesterase
VHGNLEALKVVLDEIGDVGNIYCAGDIVGYGPNPNECCDLLRQRGVQSVMGNHDIVCATYGKLGPDDNTIPERLKRLAQTTLNEMNSIARKCCEWTYNVLTEDNRQYLRGLPLALRHGKVTVIHGSPGSDYHKLNTYLQEKYETLRSSRKSSGLPFTEFCKELLDEVKTKMLIVGHTHIPYKGYVYGGVAHAHVLSHENWVVNPGSVGQPRRGKDATYAMVRFPFFPYLRRNASFRFLDHNVRHHQVPYDRAANVRRIEAIAGLPEDAKFMLTRWF